VVQDQVLGFTGQTGLATLAWLGEKLGRAVEGSSQRTSPIRTKSEKARREYRTKIMHIRRLNNDMLEMPLAIPQIKQLAK